MRFAVDAHAIGRHLTGNEVYVRSLLNGFAALDRESEFIAYLSMEDAANWIPERFAWRRIAGNPFVRLGWDLSHRLRRDRPQLLHVQYTAPLNCPAPIVVSVHDVSFLEHPEFLPLPRTKQLQWTVSRTIRRAARIVTGSEFSRTSIARAYGLEEERIAVVPNAAAPGLRPQRRESAINRVRSRFHLPDRFILCVGDLQPRKNQFGLIRAFAELIREHSDFPHHLALAGKETWFTPRVREIAVQSGVMDRIHFLGFVSDDDLLQLYNGCEFFVFPSFYEGFGLPILEAMACGRAVACSNSSAMPEVADGAALLFDPHSCEQIVRAMRDLILEPELRARLERLGLQRSAHFSWQKTAQRTLDLYYEVAEARHARGLKASAASLPSR